MSTAEPLSGVPNPRAGHPTGHDVLTARWVEGGESLLALYSEVVVQRDLARDAAVALEGELAATMNRLACVAADIEAVPTAGLTAFGALRAAAGLVSQTVLDMLDTDGEEAAL